MTDFLIDEAIITGHGKLNVNLLKKLKMGIL